MHAIMPCSLWSCVWVCPQAFHWGSRHIWNTTGCAFSCGSWPNSILAFVDWKPWSLLAADPPFYHFSAMCAFFQTVAHHRCLGSLSADEQEIGASETCTTPSQKWYLVISAVWHLIDAAYHFYSLEVKEEIGWGLLTIIWPGLRKLSDWNWKSPVARSSVNIIPLENLKNKRNKKYRCWEHL